MTDSPFILDPSKYEGRTAGDWVVVDGFNEGDRPGIDNANLDTSIVIIGFADDPSPGGVLGYPNARLIADAPALLSLAIKQAAEIKRLRDAAENILSLDPGGIAMGDSIWLRGAQVTLREAL